MSNDRVHPVFGPILDAIQGKKYEVSIPQPYDEEGKIPTSEGNKTIPEIMDHLMWCSYKSHRDRGETSHELLVKNGIGNEAMKFRYNNEFKTNNNEKQS